MAHATMINGVEANATPTRSVNRAQHMPALTMPCVSHLSDGCTGAPAGQQVGTQAQLASRVLC